MSERVEKAETLEGMWQVNAKQTFDAFQDLILTGSKTRDEYVAKVLHDNQILSTQAMQNAIENANFLSKQVIGNNVIMAASLDAIAAAIAGKVIEKMTITAKL